LNRLEFTADYMQTEGIQADNFEQRVGLELMISNLRVKIDMIGEGKIERPKQGSSYEQNGKSIIVESQSGIEKADSLVVDRVISSGFSRTTYDGATQVVREAKVKVITKDQFEKLQSLPQGSIIIPENTKLGMFGGDDPILLTKDLEIERTQEGKFEPTEGRGITKNKGIEYQVIFDENGKPDLKIIHMPKGTDFKTEEGDVIVLEQDLSVADETGAIKKQAQATVPAYQQGKEENRFQVILTSDGEILLKSPSISHSGIGSEIQANQTIAEGILAIGLKQGKITSEGAKKLGLGNVRTDIKNDIALDVDGSNVYEIKGQKVIVFDDIPFLSQEGGKEQHISAGLRRGADKKEVVVYMTRQTFENMSKNPKELEQAVMHEYKEVMYLRGEAKKRKWGLQTMSDELKSGSAEAKVLIEEAHKFAQEMPVLRKVDIEGIDAGVSMLESATETEPVAVIDLGTEGFDITSILEKGEIIPGTSEAKAMEKTAQQVAEIINSGEYKMIVIPENGQAVSAEELQAAYDLLDIKDLEDGKVAIIAHGNGTKIAVDSMAYVSEERKPNVKYLLMSPKIEADTLAKAMTEGKEEGKVTIKPNQVMTVTEELAIEDGRPYGSEATGTNISIKEAQEARTILGNKGHSGVMAGLLEKYNNYVRINNNIEKNIFSVSAIYRDFIHGEFESMANAQLDTMAELIGNILEKVPGFAEVMIDPKVRQALLAKQKPEINDAQRTQILDAIGSVQRISTNAIENAMKPAAPLTNL